LARKTRLIATAALAGSILLGTATSASADTPRPPSTHVVQSGDTLSQIGLMTQTPWQVLAYWNHLTNPNLIIVGEVIQIPPWLITGSIPKVPARPATAVHSTGHAVNRSPRSTARTMVPTSPRVRTAPAQTGSYQACVAWRESGNGMAPNIYGFLQSTWSSLGLSGSPSTASRAQQDAAFQMLYAKAGRAPWSPYDGC